MNLPHLVMRQRIGKAAGRERPGLVVRERGPGRSLSAEILSSSHPLDATREASNSPLAFVAQPSRLRVQTASRRWKRSEAGRPPNSPARMPAPHQNENCWLRARDRTAAKDLLSSLQQLPAMTEAVFQKAVQAEANRWPGLKTDARCGIRFFPAQRAGEKAIYPRTRTAEELAGA